MSPKYVGFITFNSILKWLWSSFGEIKKAAQNYGLTTLLLINEPELYLQSRELWFYRTSFGFTDLDINKLK